MATDGPDEFEESLPHSNGTGRRVNVLFYNTTARDVRVMWIDFIGNQVVYAILGPKRIISIYTYEYHPWIFEDDKTGDRMLCDGQVVYMPKFSTNESVTPTAITNPCYSLRQWALNAIRDTVSEIDNIDPSQIPESLLKAIRKAIYLKEIKLEKYGHCNHLRSN